MPKIKQSKTKPRSAKARRATRSQNPGPISPIDVHEHESTLVGLTNPFSDEAANARYPDAGAGRSLTYTHRMLVPLVADANGALAIAVTTKSGFPYLIASSIAGNVVTWPATYAAGGDMSTTLLNVYGLVYRPTSFGFRLVNLASATTASGYIVIARGGVPILGTTTTFAPNNFASWDMHPARHGGEWHAVGQPRSSASYGLSPVNGFSSNVQNPLSSWDVLYLAAFGLSPNSTTLQMEIVLNYEYTPQEDAPISQLSQPQPTADFQMQAAVNSVQASHPTSHIGGKAAVAGFVKREAKKALLKHVIPFAVKKATQFLA